MNSWNFFHAKGFNFISSEEGMLVGYTPRRRARHDIIMEILRIAMDGVRKTNIMYKVRLSHAQMEKYLNALKEEGFIREEMRVWKTTEKGHSVIDACKLCHSLMETVP